MKRLLSCLHEDSAVTAIEYALLASLLAVAVVASIRLLGGQVLLMYGHIKDQIILALS